LKKKGKKTLPPSGSSTAQATSELVTFAPPSGKKKKKRAPSDRRCSRKKSCPLPPRRETGPELMANAPLKPQWGRGPIRGGRPRGNGFTAVAEEKRKKGPGNKSRPGKKGGTVPAMGSKGKRANQKKTGTGPVCGEKKKKQVLQNTVGAISFHG